MYKFCLIVLSFVCANALSPSSYAQSKDPTRPFVSGESNNMVTRAKGQLVLQTIVEQGDTKRVIINGKLLNIGDQISQYKLQKIANNYVVLSSPEQELTLSLFSTVVAKSR